MTNDTGSINFVSRSPEDTKKLGAILGRIAKEGDIFFLVGDLGAGKTCLAQGIALGLGVKENVMSPTFVLVREHKGRIPLYHIDLYRLDKIEEIVNLGLEHYLDDYGLSVIEWAEKGSEVLPRENLFIGLNYVSNNERTLMIKASGTRYDDLLKKLKSELDKWN
jgi:tRNA threonylcarbamoyladenosine biosynthesis protein TsaE